MAWEISHSYEAWETFRRGLEDQTVEWLREAVATCRADYAESQAKEDEGEAERKWMDEPDGTPYPDPSPIDLFDWSECYERELKLLETVPHDLLVDAAYDWCEINNTCSNGGFDFYIDAGGYSSICLADYETEED